MFKLALVVALLVACKDREREPPPAARPAVDAGARQPRPKPAPRQPITSPLPEVGPHPDYPTPVAAGTDKIFLLEEPDRGPPAPLDFVIPPNDSLTWTGHAHCAPSATTITCAGSRAKRLAGWRIGRKGTDLVVAESRYDDVVQATHVYVMAEGATTQRLTFDEYGRLESALLFASPTRYSGRERNGANALAGCGYMGVELGPGGRLDVVRCLQWLGEPMRDTRGVATTKYRRDPRGFVVAELRLGLDGAPIAASDGIHELRYELDPDGRVLVERYRGVDGKPVASTKGCHGRRTEYDAGGQVARTSCLGADDKPSNDTTGASARQFTYDERGCRISMRIHAAAGSAKPQGHGADYVVDDHCAITSHTCVNAAGDRMLCGTGDPARYDYKRDAAGHASSTQHYAVDGTPDEDPVYGVFEVRRELDDLGNETSRACFDANAKPVTCGRLGFHRDRAVHDAAGRESVRTFFDERGAPALNLAAASRRFRYDNYDHSFEATGYDAAGTLVESYGVATRRDLYDAAHRRFAVVVLDKAGKPARYTGCYAGHTCPASWHAVRIVRRGDGTPEKNQFFDFAGQLVKTMDCKKVRCFQ